jgi:hypothetical protein
MSFINKIIDKAKHSRNHNHEENKNASINSSNSSNSGHNSTVSSTDVAMVPKSVPSKEDNMSIDSAGKERRRVSII